MLTSSLLQAAEVKGEKKGKTAKPGGIKTRTPSKPNDYRNKTGVKRNDVS